MATVAYTTIRHGLDDGKVLVVNEGDPVPSDLPKEVVQSLQDQGLVGEPPSTPQQQDEEKAQLQAQNEDLEKQVNDLKRQLAAAKK
jgi:hypothetical protein